MDEAAGLLEGELGSRVLAEPVTEDVWRAFLRFGRRLFRVPHLPDADGLLVQYGTWAFDGPRRFMLDLVRQFEVSDADGEHCFYAQVHCELRYGRTPALGGLGSFTSWFFHGGGDDLDEWSRGLTERAAWTVIRGLQPAGIRVYQEQV